MQIVEYVEFLKSQLIGKQIKMTVTLNNVELLTLVNKDVIGGILQDMVLKISENHKIKIKPNEQSQTFPDFFIETKNGEEKVELKSFDFEKSPNFDIANFDSYCKKVYEDPSILSANYIILGYKLDEVNKCFTIEQVFSKKIHELCSKQSVEDSEAQIKLPLKCQIKKNVIHNIRPINFKNEANVKNKISDVKEFIEILGECQEIYSACGAKTYQDFNKDKWVKDLIKKIA